MKEEGKDEISRQYYDRAQNLVRWGKAKRRVRNLDTIV
jgi:hypothetical protein